MPILYRPSPGLPKAERTAYAGIPGKRYRSGVRAGNAVRTCDSHLHRRRARYGCERTEVRDYRLSASIVTACFLCNESSRIRRTAIGPALKSHSCSARNALCRVEAHDTGRAVSPAESCGCGRRSRCASASRYGKRNPGRLLFI